MSLDKVTIRVPSSSANVGVYYDAAALGVEDPYLEATLEQTDQPGVEVVVHSRSTPPEGRILGQAGRVALEAFCKKHGNQLDKRGLLLSYFDVGYPVGGLGRSGAEAVGAVTAAAVILGVHASVNELIRDSAEGEPGKHMDNVAGSMLGRLTLVVPPTQSTPFTTVDAYDVPPDLSLIMGYSSFQKTGGTESGRRVLQSPVEASTFNRQMAMASGAVAALVSGNTKRFLELVTQDGFHQPRRADVGFYGNFNASQFLALQKRMYDQFGIAWNISGAGPNMQLLHSTHDHPDAEKLVQEVSAITDTWFDSKGINMKLVPSEIAKSGAYGYAVREYGYGP